MNLSVVVFLLWIGPLAEEAELSLIRRCGSWIKLSARSHFHPTPDSLSQIALHEFLLTRRCGWVDEVNRRREFYPTSDQPSITRAFRLPRRLSLTCSPSAVAGDGAFYPPTHSSPPSDFLGRLHCHSPVSYAPPPLRLLEPSPIRCRGLVPSDPSTARPPTHFTLKFRPDEPG